MQLPCMYIYSDTLSSDTPADSVQVALLKKKIEFQWNCYVVARITEVYDRTCNSDDALVQLHYFVTHVIDI